MARAPKKKKPAAPPPSPGDDEITLRRILRLEERVDQIANRPADITLALDAVASLRTDTADMLRSTEERLVARMDAGVAVVSAKLNMLDARFDELLAEIRKPRPG